MFKQWLQSLSWQDREKLWRAWRLQTLWSIWWYIKQGRDSQNGRDSKGWQHRHSSCSWRRKRSWYCKSYSILHRQAHCYRAYSCGNRCAMYRSVSNIQWWPQLWQISFLSYQSRRSNGRHNSYRKRTCKVPYCRHGRCTWYIFWGQSFHKNRVCKPWRHRHHKSRTGTCKTLLWHAENIRQAGSWGLQGTRSYTCPWSYLRG